jgi:hypothetical protein
MHAAVGVCQNPGKLVAANRNRHFPVLQEASSPFRRRGWRCEGWDCGGEWSVASRPANPHPGPLLPGQGEGEILSLWRVRKGTAV